MAEETRELTHQEKQEDIQARMNELNKELQPLLGKYQFGIGAEPRLSTDGRIGAATVLIDLKFAPKKQEAEQKPAEIKED